jgi:TATA-box binding protein (TBP) (component of TFIID and TFIIIB)
MGKFIESKFQGICAETSKPIKKGQLIYFDGKAYSEASKVYKESKEAMETLAHILANENAYFDNFCLKNNI